MHCWSMASASNATQPLRCVNQPPRALNRDEGLEAFTNQRCAARDARQPHDSLEFVLATH